MLIFVFIINVHNAHSLMFHLVILVCFGGLYAPPCQSVFSLLNNAVFESGSHGTIDVALFGAETLSE